MSDDKRDKRLYTYTTKSGIKFISKKAKKEGDSASTTVHKLIMKAKKEEDRGNKKPTR